MTILNAPARPLVLLGLGVCALVGAPEAVAGTVRPVHASTTPAHHAVAEPEVPAVAREVVADCTTHDGVVTSRYSTADVATADAAVKAAHQLLTPCGRGISSVRAAHGKPRAARRVSDVIRDCVTHTGALTGRYTAASLARALDHATDAVRTETSCPIGIASQYNALRPKGTAPRKPAIGGPLARRLTTTSPQETADALSTSLAAFARPQDADDTVPSWAGLLGPSQNHAGYDATDVRLARVLGAHRDIVIAPGTTTFCSVFRAASSAVVKGCSDRQVQPGRLSPGITRTPGGLTLWAPALVGLHDVRALTAAGRWVAIPVVRDAVERVFPKVPRLVTYRDATNRTHYTEFNGIARFFGG